MFEIASNSFDVALLDRFSYSMGMRGILAARALRRATHRICDVGSRCAASSNIAVITFSGDWARLAQTRLCSGRQAIGGTRTFTSLVDCSRMIVG